MTETSTFQCITITPFRELIVNQWLITGPAYLLRRLQDAVEGHVEVLYLSSKLHMWLNEEGAFGHSRNHAAEYYSRQFASYHDLFGNAVLTGGVNENNETLPLTDDQVRLILSWGRWPRRIEETAPL